MQTETQFESDDNSVTKYLCNGRLLLISAAADTSRTLEQFQHHWRQSQPIIVENVHNQLNRALWTVDAIAKLTKNGILLFNNEFICLFYRRINRHIDYQLCVG